MRKILVIEDNQNVRENICEILDLAGYHAIGAIDGTEGVRKAISEKPDLIICDIMMPKLDGYGVLKIVQNSDQLKHIPLIFLSAKSEISDIRKGMGIGAEDYITKPFEDIDLLNAVEIRIKKFDTLTSQFRRLNTLQERNYSKQELKKYLTEIFINFEILELEKNIQVYRKNEFANNIYYIKEGIVLINNEKSDGKSLITEIKESGTFIGIEEAFLNISRTNSAMTYTKSKIIKIPKNDFFEIIFNNKKVMYAILTESFESNIQKNNHMSYYAYGTVKEKLISTLKELAIRKNDDLIVEASRAVIAQRAGVTKESIIRAIGELKSEGILKLERNKLILIDHNK